MNKGFFVVFLGIIVGAMALIFLNQASGPTSVSPQTTQTATADEGAPSSGEETAPAPGQTVASLPPNAPGATRPTPPARPEPVKPEPVKPEPVKPEPSRPEPVTPAPAKPEPAKPEPVKPEPAKPEAAKPEPAKPEPAATPAPVKPEPAKPENGGKPAQATPAPAATPVTARPETQAPAGPVKKSLVLRNIGLHFRDNGMVLRIEADGAFSYKTFALPKPDRYVVDLAGTWKGMRAPTVPSNMMIKAARIGQRPEGPRLVLDMQRAPKRHSVTWVAPNILEIVIE